MQRAAGSAEVAPGAGSGTAPGPVDDETAAGSTAGSAATPVKDPDAAPQDGPEATRPDRDGLTELSSMFTDADPQPAVEPVHAVVEQHVAPPDDDAAPDPADRPRASPPAAEADVPADVEATDPERVAHEDVDEPEPDVEASTEAEREPDLMIEPASSPVDLPDAQQDVVAEDEPEADSAPEPEAEPAVEADPLAASEPVVGVVTATASVADDDEPAPGPDPEPARTVTVRTDSLTAPRSTRPGLAGVAETALTPSVRGDRAAAPELGDDVLVIDGLTKRFDEKVAVDDIALTVRAGSFYGIVGPNGAGKTTTMSMVTGLLRPDAGTVTVNGIDVWADPLTAKRSIGVLPDRLRLFDRLTGAQLLHYSGALRGLDDAEIRSRSADLIAAFGLEDAVGRLVTDYSAGMTKKVALACAMIHSPRMLVLDEPFESVDPVSAANVVEILQDYVAHGGTVVLSSHGMDFIQRICDHVAIIVNGRVLAAGTMDEVRAGRSLEERFVALAGGRRTAEGFSWLHSFSD